jgi:hypothetical protein
MSRTVWSVLHTVIEGDTIDRDRGWPDLELELHPMGTALPADEQSRELHISIGSKKTVLNEKGIEALMEFLILKPTAAGSHPDD